MTIKKYGLRPSKPRSKATPIISLTGSPPPAKQAWWSQRFIEVLESFKLGSRLARGRAYAQEAKVMKLSLSSGTVTATVQGSKKVHYKVTIGLEPLADGSWRQAMSNMTKKAIYAVELLQDKMPMDIEETFINAGTSLFPSQLEDLESSCDCPDWSNPCKHIAATYYILAQHFDLDPFLIFVWRGRLKTQIMEFLRDYWKQGKPKTGLTEGFKIRPIGAKDYIRYWNGAMDTAALTPLDPFSRSVPDSSIRRLGAAPVQLDDKDMGVIMAESYLTTSQSIRDWVFSEERSANEEKIVIPTGFSTRPSTH